MNIWQLYKQSDLVFDSIIQLKLNLGLKQFLLKMDSDDDDMPPPLEDMSE